MHKILDSYFMQFDHDESGVFVAIRTVRGSGVISAGSSDNMYVFADSLLILPKNSIQTIRFTGTDWLIYCFEFLGGNAMELPLHIVLPCERRSYEESLFEECVALLEKSSAAGSSAASTILAMLLQVWLQTSQPNRHRSLHWERIEQIREYMLAHLNEDISVTKLARIVDLSERRFRDLFRQQVGLSPKQYLQNLRIQRAEKYLLDTSCSIKEIAQLLGYSNQFHFNRAFREVHGKSPSAFRMHSQ